MIKYAKVINEKTGLCKVGTGTNSAFYESIGMTKMDVAQSDIDGNWYLADKVPMKTEEQKAQEERARLDDLYLTRGDVFESFILAKGLGQAQIRTRIEAYEGLSDTEKLIFLNRFDNTLNFYRSHPIIDLLGQIFGITPEMFDAYFEAGNDEERKDEAYKELLEHHSEQSEESQVHSESTTITDMATLNQVQGDNSQHSEFPTESVNNTENEVKNTQESKVTNE